MGNRPKTGHGMPTKDPRKASDGRPGLRMNQLARASGVPKSTILHYVKEGLLPEPVKTSPNMAYYAPECIDRIRYIQHLQRRHRLSLTEIRHVLEARGDRADLGLYLGLEEIVFGNRPDDEAVDRRAFRRVTGLSDAQVAALLEARLLLPLETDRFDREDVTIGKMFADAFANGIRVEDLSYYVTFGEKIVDHELALRRKLTHHLPYEADAAFTIELVKRARASRAYIIDRLFQSRVAAMQDLKEGGDPP
jgi:DNA-binding transcriptional MerR regulator